MRITGTIHKLGDHIDTDVILPGRHLSIRDPAKLAEHCLEGLDPDFAKRANKGDLIVAGRNFGAGSSREHAPMALKAVGLGGIVAASFARIFYRNAVNIGLPVLVCPEFTMIAENGKVATVDFVSGNIDYEGVNYKGKGFPEIVQAIVSAGGLASYVRQKLSGNSDR